MPESKTLPARYARLIHRNRPNRPHISSDISNFKQRRDKIDQMRPNLLARPAVNASKFSSRLGLRSSAPPSRPAPPCASAPPVKGCLRFTGKTRKPFFHHSTPFSKPTTKYNQINEVGESAVRETLLMSVAPLTDAPAIRRRAIQPDRLPANTIGSL